MTENQFRKLALGFADAVESAHMGHPDFRVKGKIFATLTSADGQKLGMVKLTPDQQASFLSADPGVFLPCKGAWGKRGYTNVRLASAKRDLVKAAMELAYEQVAAGKAKPAKKSQQPRGKQAATKDPKHRRLSSTTRQKRRAGVVRIIESLPEAAAVDYGPGHLSLEAANKRFGYFLDDHHGDGRLNITCKAKPGENKKLANKHPDRFHIAKYLGRHGWVGLWLDLGTVDWNEVRELLINAYRLAAPKRLVRKLDVE